VDVKYTIKSHLKDATFELNLFWDVTLLSLLYVQVLAFSRFYCLNYLVKIDGYQGKRLP
jgi:hypothetical protein